jgi:hypothetical protein
MVTLKAGMLTKWEERGQCYCAPETGSFMTGWRRPPAAALTMAINGMQRTGTIRTFIKPTHKSVTQTIVFLQVMIYLALANAKTNKNDPQNTTMLDSRTPDWETLACNNILCVMFWTYYYMQLDLMTSLTIISQIRILFEPTKCWICCSLVWNYITQLSKELGRKYAREWTLQAMKCEGSTDTLDLCKNSISQTVLVCLCINHDDVLVNAETCSRHVLNYYNYWLCNLLDQIQHNYISHATDCMEFNSTNCYISQLLYAFEFDPLLTMHLHG